MKARIPDDAIAYRLCIGQDVAVVTFKYRTSSEIYKATPDKVKSISRKTKQITLESGMRFDATGRELGESWSRGCLFPMNDQVRAAIETTKLEAEERKKRAELEAQRKEAWLEKSQTIDGKVENTIEQCLPLIAELLQEFNIEMSEAQVNNIKYSLNQEIYEVIKGKLY